MLVDGLGPSSSPLLAEDANCHAGRGPNIRAAAAAARPKTSTASPNTDPVGLTAPTVASKACSSPVNNTLMLCARAPNRRSQPRTVLSGRPNNNAIGRCPRPVAFANNAPPITTAVSARRASNEAGNSTCVHEHPKQIERRGRELTTTSLSRTPRDRAEPHGRNSPPQPGQPSSPPVSNRSTSSGSVPTINKGASKHQATALPSGQGMGRAAALPGRRHTLVANEKGQPAGLPFHTIVTVDDVIPLHVVNHGVAQHHAPALHGARRCPTAGTMIGASVTLNIKSAWLSRRM